MMVIVILLFVLEVALTGCAMSEEAISYLDASVPGPDNWIKPAPADGSVSPTNPPSFRWLPEQGAIGYVLQYSRSKDFRGESTVTNKAIKFNLHHPAKPLKPGKWYWRYRAVFPQNRMSEWSSVRSFTIPKDVVEFVLPPMHEILDRIPKGRPRLFVRPEELPALRESCKNERRELWEALLKRIEGELDKPILREPAPYPDGKWDVNIWRKYLTDSRNTGDRIEHLAFGYLITGDRRYAEAAKEQILEYCNWDPTGTSSYEYNDEVAMPIILSVSRAYDWMYDAFTADERAKIQEMMRIRGGEIYKRYIERQYHVRPYDSHATRVLKFLGQESIAFLGEIPEASEWLEYLLNIFYCIYPPWGGTDGSYHEGPSYWSAYFGWAQQFATALQKATGLDLYKKPFFRNTGYWALYCVPPYSAMAPFGDGGSGKPGAGQAINLYRLSSVYKDPYLRWYADQLLKEYPKSLICFLWYDDSVKAKPPTDLPQSRAFSDCGVVAMHSRLGDAKEDVYLLLKSDPYGSISHAYAEQNSFYLQAFGEPLAISSGYYPWYGSEHHKQWVWQTRAHNSILVNGEGQVPRSASSKGRIVRSIFSSRLDYACGDATQAYGGRLEKFLRHVLFLRPEYFVIIDELVAKEPSTFDWLLHSWEKMEINDQKVNVRKNEAHMLVQFVEPGHLKLSQTDQFTAPPEREGLANQWHLTASTVKPSRQGEFITVLYPYKSGNGALLPKIERIENIPGVKGATVASNQWRDTIIFNKLGAPLNKLGIKSDGRIVVVRDQNSSTVAIFVLDGTCFNNEVHASSPITFIMEKAKAARSIVVNCSEPTKLRLTMHEARSRGLLGEPNKVGRSAVLDDMRDPRLFRGYIKVDGKRLATSEYTFDSETGTLIIELKPGTHTVQVEANFQP
ncbi:MAG: DUF4962 domain-containing protein [Armatimonadota bacterium]|nr:DUF4962 domain-containing protein [Armatimonadota bacterium]